MDFDSFGTAADMSSADEMHSEHNASGPATTSASQTLVVSEDPKIPPEAEDPPKIPRALKKKPRTGATGKGVVVAENPSAPQLDDEMLDIATHFIGFRDEADTLRRALRAAQEHAKELERSSRLAKMPTEMPKQRLKVLKVPAGMPKQKRIGEMYTRNQEQEEDELLDSLSVLEMNCTLMRDCLKEGRAAFKRLFSHFFPKNPVPDKFEPLAKCFNGKDDPILAHRQSALKIGVEGTIALSLASGEKVDWAKVATVRGLTKEKWTSLMRNAKAFLKKLIAIIDPTASSSTSTAQTEVK
ncbi:hypothetical protein ACQ4PT_019536 [Festuca glaucescens]